MHALAPLLAFLLLGPFLPGATAEESCLADESRVIFLPSSLTPRMTCSEILSGGVLVFMGLSERGLDPGTGADPWGVPCLRHLTAWGTGMSFGDSWSWTLDYDGERLWITYEGRNGQTTADCSQAAELGPDAATIVLTNWTPGHGEVGRLTVGRGA